MKIELNEIQIEIIKVLVIKELISMQTAVEDTADAIEHGVEPEQNEFDRANIIYEIGLRNVLSSLKENLERRDETI